MDTIIQVIQTVGFPIVVCGWFMVRLEKKLELLTNAIHSLVETRTEPKTIPIDIATKRNV